MRDFEPIDPNAPFELQQAIEDYPNFLGQSKEGLLTVVDEINFLNTIDWESYRELVSTLKDPVRHFNVEVGLKTLLIPMDPFEDISFALDEIPSIDVQVDKEYSIYSIFLKEGHTYEEAFGSILSLAKAIETDIEHLQDLAASES
jgi:hypothetical protein